MESKKSEYCRATFFYREIMNAFNMDFSLYEDLVKLIKPESVLEIGCGMGRLFKVFEQKTKFITGIDLNEEMINQGRKYFAENNLNDTVVEFCKADIRSFSTGRQYDMIVIALSALKHLKTNDERMMTLRCAKKHLNKNGFIIIDHAPFPMPQVQLNGLMPKIQW